MRQLIILMAALTLCGCKGKQDAVDNVPNPLDQQRQAETDRVQQLESEVARMRAERSAGRYVPQQPNYPPVATQARPATERETESKVDREDMADLYKAVIHYNHGVDQYYQMRRDFERNHYRYLHPGSGPRGAAEYDPMKKLPTEVEIRQAEEAAAMRDAQKVDNFGLQLHKERQWIQQHRFGNRYQYEEGKGEFRKFILR